MRRSLLASIGFAAALSVAPAALAASQSFESPVLPADAIQYGPAAASFDLNVSGPVVMSGMTFLGFAGVTINTGTGATAFNIFANTPYGSQTAFIQYNFDPASAGAVEWSVSGLTVGRSYTLTFADAAAEVAEGESFSVSAPGGATDAFTGSSDVWQTQSYQFTAVSASETITFADTSSGFADYATALDDFSLTPTTPEPATWALMLAGFAGLGGVLRGRRKLASV
jgi:hypothetical protein